MADTENNKNSNSPAERAQDRNEVSSHAERRAKAPQGNSPASTSAPALRFPSFTEPWKPVTLGDITYNFSRRNKECKEYPMYSVTNNRGFIPQNEQFEDREMVGDDVKSYKIIEHGEFAYNPARINVGSIARYVGTEPCMISSLYVCFKPSNEVDGSFLMQFLKSPKANFYYNVNGEGGVRIYLFYPNFARIRTAIPSLSEQCKISSLFKLLDERIATQRRLIEDLEKLKSSIVDRIFSDVNGEVVKYRDVLEVSNLRNDGKADYSILSASQEFGMIERESLDIDIKAEAKSVKAYKRVHAGDYVLHLRSFQGGLAFAEVEGICSPAYTILRPNKRLEYGYLKEYFNSQKFIKSLVLVTYGIRDGRTINVDEFLEMNISIHSKDKQAEIVKSFSVLSEKLRLEKKILYRYERQRTYLLNQLFI